METKHTPGPWIIGNPTEIHDVDGTRIVMCCQTSDDVTDDASEANARLIAAAPELLEALKGVVRVADRATDEFDAARAAIAKATGSRQ